MARRRKPLTVVLALNTVVLVVEVAGGIQALAPVLAGGLVLASGRPVFDSLVALLIAAVIVVTTIRSVVGSHKELLWPENVVCGHE